MTGDRGPGVNCFRVVREERMIEGEMRGQSVIRSVLPDRTGGGGGVVVALLDSSLSFKSFN